MGASKHSIVSVFLLIATVSTAVFGWRSELYPANWAPPGPEKQFYTDKMLQDFSYAGYQRGEVPIPDRTGPLYDVTQPPYNANNKGESDATAAIQAAIVAAEEGGGGVVWLPEGSYRIAPGSAKQALKISRSNVVLRGAGVGKTFLLNTQTSMRDKHLIRFEGSGGGWTSVPSGSPVVAFTKDLLGPTATITVANATAFQVGEWVIVRSDITNGWADDHFEPDWRDRSSSFSGMIYLRQIEEINGSDNTIKLDIPVRYAMKVRDNARLYRASSMISEVGIEDLSIGNLQNNKNNGWGEEDYKVEGNGAYDVHASYLVVFEKARNGWMRRVESYQPEGNSSSAHLLSNGVLLSNSRGITVESCHLQRSQYGGGGGNGYMYRLAAQENLIKDSRATYSRHGFVLSQMGASGNVFLRCYDKDAGLQTGLSGRMKTSGRGSDHHMHFSHSNLFDNCTAENSNFQAAYRPYGTVPKHNLTAAHSVYWRTKGLGTQDSWVVHTQQSRYGYAIGTWGTVTQVKTSGTTTASESRTTPVDHTEGIGTGEGLFPISLYEDQLSKRIADRISTPYGDAPHPIPGTIEIEEFDRGGQGVAYFDTDGANEGDADFRRDEGVDISLRDGGMSVTHSEVGEWLNFTVDVLEEGDYNVELRGVALEAGKKIRLSSSKESADLLLEIPVQPDWQSYGSVSGQLFLPKGIQKIRLQWEGAPASLNWVQFETVTSIRPQHPLGLNQLVLYPTEGSAAWRWEGSRNATVRFYRANGALQAEVEMSPGDVWRSPNAIKLFPQPLSHLQ